YSCVTGLRRLGKRRVTFVKLTPHQPKIATSRDMILSQRGRGNADALSAAALHAALHPSDSLLWTLALAGIAVLDPESLPAALRFRRRRPSRHSRTCTDRHAILRNYPIAADIRFILEHIRPELRQYFFEAEKDGTPFPRDKRAIVYQRAKQQLDRRPLR